MRLVTTPYMVLPSVNALSTRRQMELWSKCGREEVEEDYMTRDKCTWQRFS